MGSVGKDFADDGPRGPSFLPADPRIVSTRPSSIAASLEPLACHASPASPPLGGALPKSGPTGTHVGTGTVTTVRGVRTVGTVGHGGIGTRKSYDTPLLAGPAGARRTSGPASSAVKVSSLNGRRARPDARFTQAVTTAPTSYVGSVTRTVVGAGPASSNCNPLASYIPAYGTAAPHAAARRSRRLPRKMSPLTLDGSYREAKRAQIECAHLNYTFSKRRRNSIRSSFERSARSWRNSSPWPNTPRYS